ncbi:hypothetical protein CLV90_0507 [Maribacter spongiicola]|uniref:Uncharacterized protein n=1 Tax=Maribacter spongiicola TaxID=1206753 RepID=A0A4R7K5F6_9FLAO|nr:hypothetical protein [Maribacter spongiicola]TDT46457.1 hypothetical protein CLV90_0507 [Maribacter spongiicola]
MNTNNLNSIKAFKYGMLEIGLLLIVIALIFILNPSKFYAVSIVIGFLLFIIGFISIVGCIISLKGIKEPNTAKKIIGIIINFGALALFLSLIFANIYDLYRVLIM